MNSKQRAIIIVALLAVGLTCLSWVPWYFERPNTGARVAVGNGSLFAPPTFHGEELPDELAHVDSGLLIVRLLIILAISGAVVRLLQRPRA